MPENPSWDSLAEETRRILEDVGVAYYRWPKNAIDRNGLPCVILNEYETMDSENFTLSAMQIRYSGRLSLLIDIIPDNQMSLESPMISQISLLAIKLFAHVYANRALNRHGHIQLGQGEAKRISPYLDGESAMESVVYAGMSIPYVITAQYNRSASA